MIGFFSFKQHTPKNVLFLIVFSCILINVSEAQRKKDRDTSSLIYQPSRVEFDVTDIDVDFHVIPGDDQGMLVTVETIQRGKDGFTWILHHLDTALTKEWTRFIQVPYDSYLLGTEYHDNHYYLLFSTSRYRNQEMELVQIPSDGGELTKMEINTVFPVQLTFFEVLGNNIILSGYTNFRPVLLTFDLDEQKPRVVPGFYDDKSDILDIIIDDAAGMFTVIQSSKMVNRRYTITTKTFTSSGDLIQQNAIDPGEKKNLIDGASTIFFGGLQYVSGTYSKKPTQYSRGLYLTKFVNGRQQLVKYHDYADLDNFFGYMRDRREQRIKERIRRKAEKGKKARFSYRLLVHDIIQRDDEYLLIAEAYYPRYSNYSNYGPTAWGGGSFNNPGFMGYKYTHAIVVSFDRNGNIIWDNSFSINDSETFVLEEYVAVNIHTDKVVLMYLKENTIRSKVIKGDEILEGKSFSPVRLSYEDDELKSKTPTVEGLETWYDQTMYAYGEQRIKNDNSVGGKLSRKVFYINKIQYNLEDQPN